MQKLWGLCLNQHQANQRDRKSWERVWKEMYVTDFNTLLAKLENVNETNASLF